MVETIKKLCLLLVLGRFDESHKLFPPSSNIKFRVRIKCQSGKKVINVVYGFSSSVKYFFPLRVTVSGKNVGQKMFIAFSQINDLCF